MIVRPERTARIVRDHKDEMTGEKAFSRKLTAHVKAAG
jgi:hypothetical protein